MQLVQYVHPSRLQLMRSLLPSVMILAALSAPAVGHNGRLAIAPAADGIVVDGDLSEWPESLPSYPITTTAFGEPPTGPEDLSASFRVAYSAADDRLFFAVEVVDDAAIVPEQANWDQADGCEIYIDPSHGMGAAVKMALYGQSHSMQGNLALGTTHGVEARRRPGHHTYEWWVDVGQLRTARPIQMQAGIDLAFDVVVSDRDPDGSFTWLSWGPDPYKLEARGRLGDLLTVADDDMGEAVSGAVRVMAGTVQRVKDEARATATFLTFLAGALLAVTLLHLLLFAFQRESRTNLYYAVFTGVSGLTLALAYVLPQARLNSVAADVWLIVIYAASLLLLYAQFHGGPTRAGKLLLLWLVYAAVVRTFLPAGWPVDSPYGALFWALSAAAYMALVAALMTIAGLVFGAVSRRRDGAWSVGISFLLFAACAGFVLYRLTQQEPLHPLLLAGILLPLAAMSYRLARSVAGVHRDLARRYDEVEALSEQLREQNRELELANIKIREQAHQVEEANRLKSDFLARMSHDLRTPLNAIIGYTRILLRRLQGEIDPRQYRNLENTRISADNLLALINDILDLSRIESGRTELQVAEVDVGQLATECAAAVESLVPEGVDLVTELNGSAGVRTDGDRLRRVLMNLLGNAVKYTESGSITLRLKPLPDGVELAVADTGVGIPAEDLPHIFDEFRQVERKDKKREGSGLGLAIAWRSVDMLGGTLTADSIVGEGSTFTVRVPRELPEVESEPA
jgi:signal transduction histidine kinase